MLRLIAEAFLLGLSSGPVCIFSCAPVLVPFIVLEKKDRTRAVFSLLGRFLLGRFVGYLLVGILAGFLGQTMGAEKLKSLSGPISIIMGISLVLFGLFKSFPHSSWCRKLKMEPAAKRFPSVVGFLTGITLCPPFLAAISGAIITGTLAGSILYFSVFFLATSLYILLLGLFGFLPGNETLQAIARVCLFLAGGWLIFKGVLLLIIR
ncbi:MAG TPA: sulfite exporter TauE/SafE family protein [Candidatus Deferrimicrobium sp.]|nr:sulfite exporter TauE/SafE family protein [Candidatus Deferrimicrobium sp.]